MNSAVQNILSKIDQLKADVAQMDEAVLDTVNGSQTVHMSYVCFDQSKEEVEVLLCFVHGTQLQSKVVYRGTDKNVADQIVDNLLDAFDDIGYCGFDLDGTFIM